MCECKHEHEHCCCGDSCATEGVDDMLSYDCGEKAIEFLFLAKDAHHELLKEKMKAAFEAKIGKKMDKVAALVVDTALVYMQDKMNEDKAREKYEDKLMEIFKS